MVDLGKKILVQRRGRGPPTFRAATHRRVAPARYPVLTGVEPLSAVEGVIKEIIHDPGRGAPLASVALKNGEAYHMVAPEGVSVGQKISVGTTAPVAIGNVTPLGRIPEGTLVCSIELSPGDGGKLVRSSGSYATVVAHTPKGTILKLPSGKSACISDLCRATIGVIAGAGRPDKPFLKAGERYHLMTAKGHKYPRVRGVAMIAAYHPYGGGRHHQLPYPSTVSRGAPPGRKVGLIAARQSGRAKKKRAGVQ